MNSEEQTLQKPSPTPSEYLEKYTQLKRGIITLQEWQEFSKDILLMFSQKLNSYIDKRK